MKILRTDIEDVLVIEPIVFSDDRGFFLETYHKAKYQELGIPVEFVQDNLSFSGRGTLRGLHYQHPHGQAKLVQVLAGHVYDVTVDVRKGSKNFGQWVGVHLSDENKRQVYIPEGFAHGFCVLAKQCCSRTNAAICIPPNANGACFGLIPDLAIDWPMKAIRFCLKRMRNTLD